MFPIFRRLVVLAMNDGDFRLKLGLEYIESNLIDLTGICGVYGRPC